MSEDMPVKVCVIFVAPDILVQVVLSGEDCHWKVMPPVVEYPPNERLNVVALPPYVGVTVAVPAVGVPLHGFAPIPLRGIFIVAPRPPPVMVILPLYEVTAVGRKRTYKESALNVVPV